METVSKIRRWVLADGLSIREVSRRTGLSRNTIRKYLRSEQVEPCYQMQQARPLRSLLEHELRLKALYEADMGFPARERRSMRGLYDVLVVEGFAGSYDTVRRYILRLKDARQVKDGYIPLEYDAGDAVQFDWSHEIVSFSGVDTKVYVAHFRACHSRKSFIRAYLRESQEMVLDAFNHAFAFYGGVPRRVIIDNPKTMVLSIGKGKERVFHPRFEAMTSYYAITPVACTPASGNEKGQVERQVQAVRRQIFAPKLAFDTLEDLNVYLEAQCVVLNGKPHPERKHCTIEEIFTEEYAVLRPAGRPFDGYVERSARVGSTCMVQYDTNSYSVPCAYASKTVSLRSYADRIVISNGSEVIAEHERIFARHQKCFSLWHYLPLLQQKPGALRDGAPFKRWDMPKPLAMIWEHYRTQSGGDRDFVELLTLYQQHGADAVEMACELALSHKTMQLSAILVFLYDLIEPARAQEMAVDMASHLQLQLPPAANCHRYNQLMTSHRETL